MLELQRLYPIADPSAGVPILEQVRQMAAAGARLVQIRDKSADGRAMFDIALAAIALLEPFGARLIVNDRVDVALASGAHGVHLGQDDLPVDAVRAILGPKRIIGYSTHSPEQARDAARLGVDYIAIGPVFVTTSKAEPDPVVGLQGVIDARSAVGDIPLVAIGGIELSTAAGVIEAGADSVAVIGDLHRGGSLESRVRQYLDTL